MRPFLKYGGNTFHALLPNESIIEWSQLSTFPIHKVHHNTHFSLGPSYHISGIGLCVCVCVRPSSLRRWSLFLLVGFTDPYNHTYSESLWWKLFKNYKRTHIKWQSNDKDSDKDKNTDKVPETPAHSCTIFPCYLGRESADNRCRDPWTITKIVELDN